MSDMSDGFPGASAPSQTPITPERAPAPVPLTAVEAPVAGQEPPWLTEALAPVLAFLGTAWAFGRNPARFTRAWLVGEQKAVNPLLLIAAVSAALIAGAACAQTPAPAASGGPPPQPCSTPEYRQLDFWVGDWELTFPAGNGQTGKASNRISKDEYGSCVITEHFTQPNGFKATSVSIYDRQRGVWRQTWVDNGGGVFVLEGGPVTGQPHVFEFRTVEPRGPQKLMMRMIWEDITAKGLVWRWQSQQPDGSWKDQWVLNYKRKG